MKKAFYGSLVYKGARGGAIIINDDSMVYKNQTATLEAEYKNIIMTFNDIERIEKENSFLFPAVTIYLKNGRHYKFIIFNRKRFIKELQCVGAGNHGIEL